MCEVVYAEENSPEVNYADKYDLQGAQLVITSMHRIRNEKDNHKQSKANQFNPSRIPPMMSDMIAAQNKHQKTHNTEQH